MINFIGTEDFSSPTLDIKQDERNLTIEEKLIEEINYGLEYNLDLISLSNDMETLMSGLEHNFKQLPIYVNAYGIITENLDKVLDYGAGIEDNLDLNNVYNKIETVTKILGLKVDEIEAGLLDNDPDDKEENENVIIRILKKIWDAIVNFIKSIINVITKIIKTFFKFIKKILGIQDPATEIKKKIEKEEKSSGGGGFGGYSGINVQTPKYESSPVSSGASKAKDDPKTAEDSIEDETIEGADSMEEHEEEIRQIDSKLLKNKKNIKRLEDIAEEVIKQYPLAVLIANHIFEFEDGDIDLFEVLTILYAITTASTTSVIQCEDKGKMNIERHINAFLDAIERIKDVFNRKKHLGDSHANTNYMDTATFYRLHSFVSNVYPIYGGTVDKESSLVAIIRNIMTGYSHNLEVASDSFYFYIKQLESRITTVNNDVDFGSIIRPLIEEKLGEEFLMSLSMYRPMISDIGKHGLSTDYKYFRSAVISFNKNEIELLVHLSNVSDYNTLKDLNLPDPGLLSNTNKNAKAFEDTYKEFFMKKLPKIAKDVKGTIGVIRFNVTMDDLKKHTDILSNKKIIATAPLMDENKLVVLELLNNLTKGLGHNLDDLEKCLKYTEKLLNNIKKDIADTEKLITETIKHIGKSRAIANRGEPLARYNMEAVELPMEERRTPKEALSAKLELMSSLKKGILTTSTSLQVTANELMAIYKNTVIPNLRNVKNLTGDRVLKKYINELIDFYEIKDGIGGR